MLVQLKEKEISKQTCDKNLLCWEKVFDVKLDKIQPLCRFLKQFVRYFNITQNSIYSVMFWCINFVVATVKLFFYLKIGITRSITYDYSGGKIELDTS